MFNNVVTPNRMANNIGMLAKAAVGETEDSMIWSQQPVTLQRKTPLNPMTAYSVRNEIFTTLDVICPRKKGMRKIKLKVDTGAAGNTLPLRTYKQMYKTLSPKDILEPTRNIKLVAYNCQEIPCLGSINLQLRFGKKRKEKASRRPSSMSLMFHQHLLLVCQHAGKLDYSLFTVLTSDPHQMSKPWKD